MGDCMRVDIAEEECMRLLNARGWRNVEIRARISLSHQEDTGNVKFNRDLLCGKGRTLDKRDAISCVAQSVIDLHEFGRFHGVRLLIITAGLWINPALSCMKKYFRK